MGQSYWIEFRFAAVFSDCLLFHHKSAMVRLRNTDFCDFKCAFLNSMLNHRFLAIILVIDIIIV